MIEAVEPRRLFSTTITVTSLADTFANDGFVTLREAIQAANTDAPFNEAPAGSGADTIVFDSSLFNSGARTLTLAGLEMTITSALTITGPGQTLLTLDAATNSRVFNINDGSTSTSSPVQLSGMILARGNAGGGSGGAIITFDTLSLSNCTVRNSTANPGSSGSPSVGGGGIFSSRAAVTLTDCTFSSNTNSSIVGMGGAINVGAASLTATRCTFTGNTAASHGGAIGNGFGGTAQLTDCTLTGNTASGIGSGGAVWIQYFTGASSPSLSLTNCTVTGNSAHDGAGVGTSGGTITIQSSFISNNVSADKGGGVLLGGNLAPNTLNISDSTVSLNRCGTSSGNGGGAGVWCTLGVLTVTRCSILDNTLNGNGTFTIGGGGLKSESGSLVLDSSVVSGNKSGASPGAGVYSTNGLTVTNSTIANNSTTGNGGGIYLPTTTGSPTRSIIHCTIAGNSAVTGGGVNVASGTLTLQGTIIANNTATTSPDLTAQATGDYNLVKSTAGAFLIGSNNITGQDPLLQTLGNYGGTTMSMPPANNSPAIDAAIANSLASDQRGGPRTVEFATPIQANFPNAPGGDGTDIGAVELQPPRISGWTSAGTHLRNVGEAALSIPDDGTFVEPRSSAVSSLLVTFDSAINPASLTPASVTVVGNDVNGNAVSLSGVTIGTSTRSLNKIAVITFTPALPDYARYAVRISGILGATNAAMLGDNDRILTALLGDLTGDRRVNNTDVGAIYSVRGIDPINPAEVNQVRSDVTNDGRLNNTDAGGIMSLRGNDAHLIADPVLPASLIGGQSLSLSLAPQVPLAQTASSLVVTQSSVVSTPAKRAHPLGTHQKLPAVSAPKKKAPIVPPAKRLLLIAKPLQETPPVKKRDDLRASGIQKLFASK